MSKFLSEKFKDLEPYTPGEQPQDKKYVKLNTNESPFKPCPGVMKALSEEAVSQLYLYSDPTANKLVEAIAEYYTNYVKENGKNFVIGKENVIVSNGSDEVLAFIFNAYTDKDKGMACPEIGYGFYPVFCSLYGVPFKGIKIRDDFSIDISAFKGISENITIANPNAQTGLYLSLNDIKTLLSENKDRIIVVDEAYCDFGGESAVVLLNEYENLIVVGTLSKSRQLAGGRVGFAIASKEIIQDLNTIKYSFNPYNLNRLSILAGVEAMKDVDYFNKTRKVVMENREYLKVELKKLGFKVTDSKSNFILVSTPKMGGKELYLKLKERGVLVRFLSDELLKNWVRITIGSKEQLNVLLKEIKEILGA